MSIEAWRQIEYGGENQHEQSFNLVPYVEDNLPSKNDDNQVRSIIEQLDDSKHAQFLNVAGKS